MKPYAYFGTLFITVAIAGLLAWPQETQALLPDHECGFCHSVHGAPGSPLLKDAQIEALCLSCHGPAGISTLKANTHVGQTCMVCHTPHDNRQNWLAGTNLKLIGRNEDGTGIARLNTPNNGIREVVFESRGTNVGEPSLHSFADADEDGNGYKDGVCETCHNATKHHCNGEITNTGQCGQVHNRGKTCTNCHEHIDGLCPSRPCP